MRKSSFSRVKAILGVFFCLFLVVAPAAAQREAVLHSFDDNGTDGFTPVGGVTFDASRNLYGATAYGGTYGLGTVFELISAKGGSRTETVLHSFAGTDGGTPSFGVIIDGMGNLYGVTQSGGAYGVGVVFELSPSAGGSWTGTTLYSFNNNGTDGNTPVGGLIFDASGNLYGTTVYGGGGACTGGCGTVFELTPTVGGSWTESVLYAFQGTDGKGPNAEGGSLIFDASGNLYGTTVGGGGKCTKGVSETCGVVFELSPSANGAWTEKVLHTFQTNHTDGFDPQSGVIFDASGNLYGTTHDGGAHAGGIVFELSPAGGSWTESVPYAFNIPVGGGSPSGGLIFDTSGNLYGTAEGGGTGYSTGGSGTVFELSPKTGGGWKEKVLHNFIYNGTDGFAPFAPLVFDSSGNLYGTTLAGGAYNGGIVFEVEIPASAFRDTD